MAVEVAPLAAEREIDHEQLIVRRGERSGLYTVIAVHSTALGPTLGGCRMWPYAATADAVDDALRLSEAMTLKAAAAGLALGGGKGVICLPRRAAPARELRQLALRDFADTLNVLDGRYITAEDVGTTANDMSLLARRSPHVAGLPEAEGGSGDPSPFTAAGVVAALRACCKHVFASPQLAGRTVAVVGLGKVGGRLARLLAAAGAELVLADLDPRKRSVADELRGASWTTPEAALTADVDIVAPCALGGMIDDADALRCRIVCGAANNQLGDESVAQELARREIVYAPDFIVNAGGLINIAAELDGYDRGRATRRVAQIEQRVERLLDEAEARGTTPLAAARQLALARLGGRTLGV